MLLEGAYCAGEHFVALQCSKEQFHWLGIKKSISNKQSDQGSWLTERRSGRQTDDQIYPVSSFHIHLDFMFMHKNSVLHAFLQLCQDLPQRVRATSKARIYQNYIFDRRK